MLGRITGLYGVEGWVKVFSYTEPRGGIIDYDPLYLADQGSWRPCQVAEGRLQGRGVILRFAGYDDRNAAVALLGGDLAVRRDQLAPLTAGEYYWSDLEGLRVITVGGVELGVVERLFETGANDVMVVAGERERLIPFITGDVIVEVDLAGGVIRVDWDPDF